MCIHINVASTRGVVNQIEIQITARHLVLRALKWYHRQRNSHRVNNSTNIRWTNMKCNFSFIDQQRTEANMPASCLIYYYF